MENLASLKRITTWTAIIVSLLVMVIIPSMYYVASYRYKSQWLESELSKSADKLSELIYHHPDTWEFQHHRLEDFLALSQPEHESIYYELHNKNGELILVSGSRPDGPALTGSAMLSDGEKNVGSITLIVSLWPLLYEIYYVCVVGIILALMVYFSLRLLPFASLAKTTQSLINARKETEQALSEQQNISEQMRFQSLHDALTGLPNRKNYIQTLNDMITKHAFDQSKMWVIILDLDRFKEINDCLGHILGDYVLMAVAERLRDSIPAEALVARLGGDEYAFIIPNMDCTELEAILKDMILSLRSHIHVQGFYLTVDASVGIADYPDHGDNQEDLMRNADIAMYHAKSSGIDWAYYDEGLKTNTPNRLKLTSDLRHALDNEHIQLHFQPKISLKNQSIIGLEALARWEHPDFGFIRPDVFIPIAEQTSMIKPLTDSVIKLAIKALKSLNLAGFDGLSMAINISARNLMDEQFARDLTQCLLNEQVDADSVTLEITETSIMYDPEHSQKIVKQLANLGFRIAIDDFGTGYSSLSYLKKLAASQVKIDRSFISNMLSDKDDYVIVESTINLAHNLGMEVVAEGVEDKDTELALMAMGCELAQGYYYSKPIQFEEIISLFGVGTCLNSINNH